MRTRRELSKQLTHYTAKRSRKLNKTLQIIVRSKHAEAVHDFRKTTRDLQCLVDACRIRRPTGRAKKVRVDLQSWRHALSSWRDGDVMIKLVERAQQKAHHTYEREVWPAIAERTALQRDRALKKFLENADLRKMRKLRKKIKALVKNHVRVEPIADNLGQLLQKTWRKLNLAIEQFERVPEVTNLHAVRIKTKSVRYALQLRQRFYPNKKIEKSSVLLKEIQDRVGEWHDELMLSQLVRATLLDSHATNDPNAAKVIEGIKEQELVMAESARRYLLTVQETKQCKRLRRVVSAAIYATSNDDDAAMHQNVIGAAN